MSDPNVPTLRRLSYVHPSQRSSECLRTAWVSSFAPTVRDLLTVSTGNVALCRFRMASIDPLQSVTSTNNCQRCFSRRTIVRTLLSCAGMALIPVTPALSFETQMETFESKLLHISVQYPKGWFRSERGGSLVLLNLPQVMAATLSEKDINLKRTSDPFSAAYDVVKDRIEQEGAEIFIKDAAFEPSGDLVFRFEATTQMPNGDNVVRCGLARCIPSLKEKSAIACVVTVPKDGWEELQSLADRIMRSVHVA